MLKILTILIMSMIFNGCFLIPKSSTELVNTTSTKQVYCYDIESKLVEERLSKFLNTCYSTEYITGYTQSGSYTTKLNETIIKEKIQNGVRYSQSNTSGYAYSADILPITDNCKTKVKMYGVSIFWKRIFKLIDETIKGGEIDCPL